MATIGRIGEFDESKESFTCYVERLEQYFIANDVDAGKKVAIFLTVVGCQTYGLLKSLTTPDLPSTKSYQQLVQLLTNYFSPKPLVIAERFKFYRRDQKAEENVAAYLVELKRLTTHCEYGDFLGQALRDRFVCGLVDEATQRKLLTVAELSLNQATEIAQAMELAEKNAHEFRPESGSQPVNKLSQNQTKGWGKKSGNNHVNKNAKSNSYKTQNKTGNKSCFRCGGRHSPITCRFKDEACYSCSGRGHIAKLCPMRLRNHNPGKRDTASTKYVEQDETESKETEFYLHSVFTSGSSAYKVNIELNGKPVVMEIDSGAALSVIPENLYRDKFSDMKLEASSVLLKTYSGERLSVLGQFSVLANYESQEVNLPVIVVKGNNPALLGRNWLEKLKLDWRNVFSVETSSDTKDFEHLKREFSIVFGQGNGKVKGFTAEIRMQKGVSPVFCKPRSVPYALREPVEKELDRLEGLGIISKIDHSKWATPIVVVPKSDNSIRICGDYKVTVNRWIEAQQYPLPNAEDIFATLSGGTVFSKLDLTSAYQQLELDENSKALLTINTHRGLYRYNRLAFGVSSAPAIFQAKLEQILQGLDHVKCRLDDILISAATEKEHRQLLNAVLKRLENYGVRLNFAKCSFMKPSVDYLGHRIDREGIHPLSEKVDAILNAPSPTNVSELKSFLGLINYYGKFIPDLSTTLQPLHQLLQKDQPWSWSQSCVQAFENCKAKLTGSQLLVHFDVKKPLKLACDASSYGVGAVISHIEPNGEEKPIAFASRTLTSSELNYPQLEKEGLSIIFGIKKFHQYLYGRPFTLETDHKPLTTILGPYNAVPTLAAARLQRWALILSAYQYEIVYRKSADHGNADALSRCPAGDSPEGKEADIFYFTYLDQLPVNAIDIREETRKDQVLSRVLDFTLNGWPRDIDNPDLKPFFIRRNELSAEQGCILWGMRVIIPPKFRERLLDDLHEVHPGMSKMKSLGRSYLWWPGLDEDIESKVRNCAVCLSVRKSPPVAPLHPWQWPKRIWQRLHIDYAEFQDQNFLIVIDSHSKWLEVFPMKSTTSVRTIETLRTLFSSYGLPEDLVSDNGPQFTSSEFKEFTQMNGIRHILTPPYHPASNGAAERSVQTVKQALKKQVLDAREKNKAISIEHRLANFLLMYRITPHSVTGCPPAELFLKRQLRNRFTFIKPNTAKLVESKQETQIKQHDKARVKGRVFEKGQLVRVRNFRRGKEKWVPGVITRKLGTLTYLVRVGGRIRYVHIDHMLPTGIVDSDRVESERNVIPISFPVIPSNQPISEVASVPPDNIPSQSVDVPRCEKSFPSPLNSRCLEPRRNPFRERKPPRRLDL